MAVAFDAVGPSGGAGHNTSTTPSTWTHICGASATIIIIGVTTFTGGSNAVTGVTYGGQTCTLLTFVASGAITSGGIAVYYLKSPPTGSNTVSVTFTGAADCIGGSISYTGGSTLGSTFTANPPSTGSVSATVTNTVTGGMITCAACFGGGGGSTFTGLDSVAIEWHLAVSTSSAADNAVAGNVASTGGGASQAVGFSANGSDDWGFIAVEIQPGGGAVAAVPRTDAQFPGAFYIKHSLKNKWRPRRISIPIPFPKIQWLIDAFATNDLPQIWPQTLGTVTWSPGVVAIKSDTSYDSALITNGPYDLTNSAIYIQITPYIATSSDIQFGIYTGNYLTTNNSLFMGFGGPSNLHIFKDVNGTQTNLDSLTYNAATMGWWRIRESAGTVFFDTAPDGVTWTNQFSTADSTFSFPLNAVGVSILGGDSGSDPAGTTFLHRVNITPAQFTSTINTNISTTSATPILRDQPATVFAAGGTTIVISWGTNPTAGSKVLVAFSLPNALAPTSVVDNSSTPITLTLDEGPGSGAQRLYIYRADNVQPTASQYKVTATFASATGGATGWGASYLNVAPGGPTSSNSGLTTGGTSVSTGNATPAHPGALYFAAMGDTSSANPETITLTNTSFTEQATQTNGSTTVAMGFADKIDSGGPTATACTWSTGDSVNLYAGIVTYDTASVPQNALIRSITRILAGTVVATSNITRALSRTLIALAVVTGSVTRNIRRTLNATITELASVPRTAGRVLSSVLTAITPTPNIRLIQHGSGVGATSAASSATITLPQATGAGNALIVAVSYVTNSAENTDLTSVTLGGSGTGFASQAKTNGLNFPFYNISYWANYSIVAGQTSVVVSVGGAANGFDVSVDVYEVAGGLVSIDQSVFHEMESTATNWTSNATGTLAQNAEFAVGLGALYNNAGTSFTITGPTAPWTNEAQLTVNTQYSQMSGYQITSSNSALTYSGTANVTGVNLDYIASVATFIQAAGLLRQVGRGLSSAVTATASTTRKILRALIATIVAAVSVVATKMSGGNHYLLTVVATIVETSSTQNTIGRILAGIVTVTGSTARSCGRGLTAGLVVTDAVIRSVGRPLNAALVVTAAVTRKITRLLVNVVVLTGNVVRLITRILTSTLVIFGNVIRTCGKPLVPVLVLTSSVTRQVSRPLTATIVVTAALVRSIMRSITAVVVLTATTVLQKFKMVLLNATIVVTSSVSRQISRPLIAVVVTTGIVVRFLSRTLNITLVLIAAAPKQVNRTFGLVITAGSSIVRQCGKPFAPVVTLTGSFTRNIGKLLNSTVVTVGSVTRNISRALISLIALVPALSAIKTKFVTLVATIVTVAATPRSVGKLLNAPVTLTDNIVRFCGKGISSVVNVTGNLTRSINRSLLVSLVLTATISLSKFKNITLNATIVTVAATSRLITFHLVPVLVATANPFQKCGKAIVAGLVITGGLTRSVFKNLTSIVVGTASITYIKVKNVLLTCTVVVTGTLPRKVLPIISSVITIASSTTRGISRPIQGTISIAGQTVRQVGRGCVTGLVATSQIVRQVGRILNAPVAVTLVMSRITGYIVATGITVSSTVTRFLKRTLNATIALVVSVTSGGQKFFVTLVVPLVVTPTINTGRFFNRTIVAGITTGVTFATKFSKFSADIVFRKGTMAFQWIVGSVSGRWKT